MTNRQRIINILKFWRAVEIFDVPSIKKDEKYKYQRVYNSRKRNIGTKFPWESVEKKGIYYQVYLCVPSRENLVKYILSLIPEAPKIDTGEREKFKENACLAAFCIDENGRPVENTYTLASFIIGIHKLSIPESLEEINDYLYQYSQDFNVRVHRWFSKNSKIKGKQADWSFILKEFEMIFNITELLASSKDIEVIINQFRINENEKYIGNSELINSFFLDELDSLVKLSHMPFGKAFEAYLSQTDAEGRKDILQNNDYFKECLQLDNLPQGRWLSNPFYSLYLAQQAAVSKVLEIEGGFENLISVNGPPGTGKTTLLHDVIADIVINRAIRLTELLSPADIFSMDSKNGATTIFTIKTEIMKNTQIVVVSSNNNAVKNISEEIPTKADHATYPKSEYFKEVALNKFGDTAWGLMAAPLGNAANKNDFVKRVYGKFGMYDPKTLDDIIIVGETTKQEVLYLFGEYEDWQNDKWLYKLVRKCAGSQYYVFVSEYFDDRTATGISIEFKDEKVSAQYVIRAYKSGVPCNMQLYLEYWRMEKEKKEVIDEWKAVKNNFQLKLQEFTDLKQYIAKAFEIPKTIKHLQDEVQKLEDILRSYEREKSTCVQELEEYTRQELVKKALITSFMEKRLSLVSILAELKRNKPSFWSKLFSYNLYKEQMQRIEIHKQEMKNLDEQLERAKISLNEVVCKLQKTESKLIGLGVSIEKVKKDIIKNNEKQKESKLFLNSPKLKSIQSPNYIFLNYSKNKQHLESAWVSDNLEKLRSELFLLALQLHELTVLAEPYKWENNIKAISEMLINKQYLPPEKELMDVWNMLFFITPVVSTTFASFSRLFMGLGKESLGWLLVDESGQSTPQMAAGAIWRSRRTVIIGDPLQIEPVMTVPNIIVEKMKKHYKVDECFCPLTASVQTVADRTMQYGSYVGDTWVGLPLRAHRRCTEPMFSVSNEIAYDNQMVQANNKPEQISCLLGDSCWFDITGSSEEQVVQEEIDFLAETLQRLKGNYPTVGNGKEAIIYVIAPFRQVASVARQLVRKLGLSRKIECGTVHTFQGKEADIVFIVLGSATGSKGNGSRNWVCRKPNLLNVALTRAKLRVYIIGNRSDWGELPYFNVLSRNIR